MGQVKLREVHVNFVREQYLKSSGRMQEVLLEVLTSHHNGTPKICVDVLSTEAQSIITQLLKAPMSS